MTGIYLNEPGSAFSDLKVSELKKGAKSLPSFNEVELPFLDREFVEKVLSLKVDDLGKITGGLLNKNALLSFSERLEHIKQVLQKRMDREKTLPEGQRTILTKEEWDKPENRERLEKSLRKEQKQLFPECITKNTEIEGAGHEGTLKKGNPDEEYMLREEKEYFTVYSALKDQVSRAKDNEEKLKILKACLTGNMYDVKGITREKYHIAAQRILEEETNPDFLRTLQKKKIELDARVAEIVEEKTQDKNFTVPPEYASDKVKKADDLRRDYAVYTAFYENKELFTEISELHSAIAILYTDSSYSNSSMSMEVDYIPGVQKGIQDEIINNDKELKRKVSFGADIIEGMYSLSNLKPEIIEKFRKDINDEGWLLNKKVLERYSIDIEDKEYIRRREKIRIREEETARKKAALRPKELQPDNTVAASVIDKMEDKGTFKVLDSLFKKRSDLSTAFRKEYGSFLDRIMEREDFTFDEKGIETLRGRIREYTEKQAESGEGKFKNASPQAVNKLIKNREEGFDALIAPELRKVFELVSQGVIGKDTAMIFINPDAMNYMIEDNSYEAADINKSIVGRKDQKNADRETEEEYKELVVQLTEEVMDDAGNVVIQTSPRIRIDHYNLDAIKENDHFIYFGRKRAEDEKNAGSPPPEVRVYVTVKEEDQNKMVSKLTEFLKDENNKKFRGAFDFKLSTGLKDHRLENMVIYVDSKKTSPELLKEFIDGFSEKIKDITMEDDELPTTFGIKQGFGSAPEPTDASRYLYRIRSTFNPLSLNEYGIEGNRNLEGKLSCFEDQVKAPEGYEISIEGKLKIGSSKMSWNQYCGRLLILSAYIARHRLNRGEKDLSVSGDKEVKKEMKQVFQEFMLLSGINPGSLLSGSTEDFIKKVSL